MEEGYHSRISQHVKLVLGHASFFSKRTASYRKRKCCTYSVYHVYLWVHCILGYFI